uniref:Uncharacterized protein n=1 Tax=Oryza brachyantha TaxID=4533 RepID=J3L4Y2_ORYBR
MIFFFPGPIYKIFFSFFSFRCPIQIQRPGSQCMEVTCAQCNSIFISRLIFFVLFYVSSINLLKIFFSSLSDSSLLFFPFSFSLSDSIFFAFLSLKNIFFFFSPISSD